ncbi:hypothetical protein GOEFS_039_00280 [Gordonia effusa NBRC 100432]|uniref:Uncharacterized protein n=1 Tax=Gordonia effusa NBRC 100432 TaxID=1077974 RepID=H0QY93_9ACTN|nr:hypothetical protein [Gordonia effusa]GAB17794.1 hypothetical protein GOEFS_039_00280 [Gordonia effusa NBRC 100432]
MRSSTLESLGVFFCEVYDSVVAPIEQIATDGTSVSVAQEVAISTIHNIIARFQENADLGGGVRLFVRGEDGSLTGDLESMSDDLKGELFSSDGWLAKNATAPVPEKYTQ